jgi:hypothetical protein
MEDETIEDVKAAYALLFRDMAALRVKADALHEAAKLVIAWYEAEDDHSKADFYQRMQMCRDSEAATRAAIANYTGA